MNEEIVKEDEEISVLDIIAVIFKFKWFIFGVTILAAIFVFAYCWISIKLPVDETYMPNIYKPKAEMLINDGSSSSGGLASALSASGLGGLASMMGVSDSGSSNSALAEYLVTSPTIQDAIIDNFFREDIQRNRDLVVEAQKKQGKYNPDKDKWKFPLMDTRDMLKEKIETSYSSATGVFTITVGDKDPELACEIINYTVTLLEKRFEEIGVDRNKLTMANLENNIDIAYRNILDLQEKIKNLDYSLANSYGSTNSSIILDTNMLKLELQVQEQIYTSLKTQYETLKVTMASEQPIFQILEYAQIPDRKSGPNRGKLCMTVTLIAFIMSIVLSYLLNIIIQLIRNPTAMEKLFPKKNRGRK